MISILHCFVNEHLARFVKIEILIAGLVIFSLTLCFLNNVGTYCGFSLQVSDGRFKSDEDLVFCSQSCFLLYCSSSLLQPKPASENKVNFH